MLKVYSFFNSLLKKMTNHEPLGLDKVCLLGGRSSGKTTAVEEFAINACDLVDNQGYPISVSVLCFRKQLMDLGEVFEQYTYDAAISAPNVSQRNLSLCNEQLPHYLLCRIIHQVI